MAYEVKDGTGSLFINDKKTNPKAPDFTGTGLYKGERVRISAWKKISKQGKNYLSLSIEKFVERNANPTRSAPRVEADDDPFAF